MARSHRWKLWGKKNVTLESSRERQQLGPDFDNRVAQLVTYGLLVTCMNMAEHESVI